MRDRSHILGVGHMFGRHTGCRAVPTAERQGRPVASLALAALLILTILAAFLTGSRMQDQKDSRDYPDERPPAALSQADPTLRSGLTLPWPLVLSGGPAFSSGGCA